MVRRTAPGLQSKQLSLSVPSLTRFMQVAVDEKVELISTEGHALQSS